MGVSSTSLGMSCSGTLAVARRVAAVAMAAMLAIVLCAEPADAKKKRKRSHYAPPQAALVIDAYTGKVIHAENADTPRFPASITKVMTLYILFEHLQSGTLSLDSPLKVSATAAAQPPSKLGLLPGGTILVRDAMYALVTKSANDAAAVIAENIAGSEPAFARMMTAKARAIGMSKTTFRNASGLPDPAQTTTARDLVTLGRRMLKDYPEEAKIFRTRHFQFGKARYKNHNGLLFTYTGTDGMKTGYTRASGFNLLTTCRRDDKQLIAVVLGGRSSSHRNARMRALLDKSWGKAVAFNDIKQRRGTETNAIAAVMDDETMPERNPAFHATDTERTLQTAMAEERHALKLRDARPPERLAVAALASGPVADDEDDAEAAPDEEGDATADVSPRETAQLGPYHIQVGSYLDADAAKNRLASVADKAPKLLGGHGELTVTGEVKGKSYFRARFGSFSEKEAATTCASLKRLKIECLVVRAE